MATLNIGGNEEDRFYRYKMPKLISKIEGKGNGIKTVVPNMSDIARSLGRPASYPTKFFGCELGAQVKVDDKNDRYIVNGAHDATRLQELLDGFIRKFVLCAGCNNPETDLIILKNDKIIRDCKACGQRTDVDMRHKLVTFILKNPPMPKGKAAKGAAHNGSSTSPSNGGKKDGRKASRKNGHDEPESPTSPTHKEKSNDYEEESDDELTRRIEAEAAELPTASQDDGDDEDWAVDTSEEAVRERLKDLEGGIRTKLVIDDDDDDDDNGEDEDDAHQQLITWLEENPSASSNDIYKKVKTLGIKESNQILKTLVLGLFDDSLRKESAIGKHVKKRGKLLKKFVTSVDDQRLLLGAIEALVGDKHTELLESKIVCKILMELYQNDLLEEDALQAWIAGPDSAKYKATFKKTGGVMFVSEGVSADVRSKAMPFSKWLEEAEEEDDDDDEEE